MNEIGYRLFEIQRTCQEPDRLNKQTNKHFYQFEENLSSVASIRVIKDKH